MSQSKSKYTFLVKKNDIFGISIKNWVDLYMFQTFEISFDFGQNLSRSPPQDEAKNKFNQKATQTVENTF
jgi:hypothetical protein